MAGGALTFIGPRASTRRALCPPVDKPTPPTCTLPASLLQGPWVKGEIPYSTILTRWTVFTNEYPHMPDSDVIDTAVRGWPSNDPVESPDDWHSL